MELGQYTTPALSSVTHARAELGEMAAQLLFEAMQRPLRLFETSETVLPVELLIRESCGAVRAGRRPQRSPTP
jgi:DNA-binding LacI/PurR family transcriptional regulator